ncbi:PorT family protein [Flavobacterium sp. CHNK8]|uniref:porin family protein n=1 Tax=Flavobacterium sp. CHNK8 TaxID=2871165 RepID=UPI001C8EFB9E|nr:porin family protein [Flavobacterium sp. CHNK8]QZK89219.1 PorT family protein [Flavobacterium sp. CHNK8]
MIKFLKKYRNSFLVGCIFISMSAFGQENQALEEKAIVKVDSLYREDQFYFAVTYNSLVNTPTGVSQNKFSSGVSLGFLRDMPVNANRTWAIATGLGFTYNNFNQNLIVKEQNGVVDYQLIPADVSVDKNKFSQLSVDVPIELRWRTSNYESHKFWRIYTGLKFSYLLYDRSLFNGSQERIVVQNNTDFNALQYGTYLAAGYNTVNLYMYYGLNPLFQKATLNGASVNMRAFNLGVIFYIL